jgi:tRNA pseudouridine32 synthase/23S rRNA pseudouridine746 synthase
VLRPRHFWRRVDGVELHAIAATRPARRHRLDFETSGVLVFARTTAAASALCAAFRKSTDGDAGDTRKTYVARVSGRLSGSGEWTAAIAPDAAARAKDGKPRYRAASLSDEGAKGARTRWEGLETGDATSLLKLEPLTGRSHQLRVHCLAAGHAIVGDPLYAAPGDGLCLHAASLALPHPETGERVTFEAGRPFD